MYPLNVLNWIIIAGKKQKKNQNELVTVLLVVLFAQIS